MGHGTQRLRITYIFRHICYSWIKFTHAQSPLPFGNAKILRAPVLSIRPKVIHVLNWYLDFYVNHMDTIFSCRQKKVKLSILWHLQLQ